MTNDERKIIKDLKKCDFKEMHAYFVQVNAVNMYWTSFFCICQIPLTQIRSKSI